MSYQTFKLADTSANGTNSYALTSGGGWGVGALSSVFTGVGEQNDYTYVGVNLQVDEPGTLTFEFSQDGTNWSKYPVTEFTVADGINEVHGAWKGTRWVRPKYTGSDGSRTFFRLRTMYSDVPIQLTAPLNQSINSDQDATITRAVAIGETPDGAYSNVKAGGIAFSTTADLTAGEVFQTEVLDLRGYTQVETHIQTDATGTLTFEFLSDPTTVVRTLNVPYTPPSFRTFGAPAFTPYVRYSFTATTSSDGFYYDTKFTTTSINGQILALEDFISPTMVANLGRNVIVGQQPDGDYVNAKSDGTAFSQTTPLTAGQVFESDWYDTDGWKSIDLLMSADVPTASNGVVLEFTDDAQAVTPVVRLTESFEFTQESVTAGALQIKTGTLLDGFRVRVTNSEVDQSTFFLQADLRTQDTGATAISLNDRPDPNSITEINRSVIMGKLPGSNDIFSNVAADSESQLKISIPKTAFGELKVAEITPTIQASFPYTTINSRVWTQTLSGTADIISSNSTVAVSAAGANSYAKLNSVRSNKYRPGQGGLVRFTSLFTAPSGGSKQEIGLGDETDGFFFCTSGDQYAVCRRRGGVDDITLQSDWNLDPADGTQVLPALDFTLGNVFEIEYQWLGYGAITFKVEQPITGDFIPVHRDQYAGREALPSVFNPTLPLRIYAENTTNTTPVVTKSSSMFAGVEGKIEITGPVFATSTTALDNGTTPEFAISIQNKETYSGSDNRVPIYLKSLIISNPLNKGCIVTVYKDVDTSALTYEDVNVNDSVMEVANGLETAVWPSSAIQSSYFISQLNGEVFDLSDVIYPTENYVLTFVMDGSPNTADPLTFAFNWQEDF